MVSRSRDRLESSLVLALPFDEIVETKWKSVIFNQKPLKKKKKCFSKSYFVSVDYIEIDKGMKICIIK